MAEMQVKLMQLQARYEEEVTGGAAAAEEHSMAVAALEDELDLALGEYKAVASAHDTTTVERDALQLRIQLMQQSGAESKIRGVAARMMNRDAADALSAWKGSCKHAMRVLAQRQRAEAVMKRAGQRMLNRDISDAVLGWSTLVAQEKAQARAENMMRRVAARMKNRELVAALSTWHLNVTESMKIERDALELRMRLLRQQSAASRQLYLHKKIRQ